MTDCTNQESLTQEKSPCSGLSHSFDSGIAEKYGVEEAIVLEVISWFKKLNSCSKHAKITPISIINIIDICFYLSPTKIKRAVNKLKKLKVISASEVIE